MTPYAPLGGIYANAIQQLRRKFNPGAKLIIGIPKRTLLDDNDETSCGVHVCFYGKQCLTNKLYDDANFDVNCFRKEILSQIVGSVQELRKKCSQRVSECYVGESSLKQEWQCTGCQHP